MFNVILQFSPNLSLDLAGMIRQLRRFRAPGLAMTDGNVDFRHLPINKVMDMREMLINEGVRIELYRTSMFSADATEIRALLSNCRLLDIRLLAVDAFGADAHRAAALIDQLTEAAPVFGVEVAIVNRYGGPFGTPRDVASLLQLPGKERVGLVMDPVEYLRTGVSALFDGFMGARYKNRIRALVIRDAVKNPPELVAHTLSDIRETLPAEGQAQVKELISILLSHNFHGFFVLPVNSLAETMPVESRASNAAGTASQEEKAPQAEAVPGFPAHDKLVQLFLNL